MNLLLTELQAEYVRKGTAIPIVLGNLNASTIAANTNTKVFEITNNVGADMHVLGLMIRYPATFDSCILSVLNTQRNRPVFSGSTTLGTVGVSSALSSQVSIMPIVPFVLTSGNFVDVLLNNNTSNIFPVRGLLLSLYGLQLS